MGSKLNVSLQIPEDSFAGDGNEQDKIKAASDPAAGDTQDNISDGDSAQDDDAAIKKSQPSK